jgi:hypothetical protein
VKRFYDVSTIALIILTQPAVKLSVVYPQRTGHRNGILCVIFRCVGLAVYLSIIGIGRRIYSGDSPIETQHHCAAFSLFESPIDRASRFRYISSK